jgi:hypothetical protein
MTKLAFSKNMNNPSHITLLLTGILIALFYSGLLLASGCAHEGYGKIRDSSIDHTKIHEFMDKEYDNFKAAYSGGEEPAAIRFDVKDDGVQLIGDGWNPVQGKEELHAIVDYMIQRYRFWMGVYRGPYLYLIVGGEGRTIGYLYSPLDHTPVRKLGEDYSVDTITIFDIREKLHNSLG